MTFVFIWHLDDVLYCAILYTRIRCLFSKTSQKSRGSYIAPASFSKCSKSILWLVLFKVEW